MADRISCFYRNSTPDIQVVRIANAANFYFERIVWPDHELFFQAPPNATLDIYSGILTSVRLDSIPCNRLRFQEND